MKTQIHNIHILPVRSAAETTVAVLGSHSALDVCRGAKDEGFRTLVVTEKGRGKVYDMYYRSQGDIGCVDEVLELGTFSQLLTKESQRILQEKNAIFIPHRSFEVYLDFNYEAIEKTFSVPMFGNRFLLKIEERGVTTNQYDLLDAAKIRYPVQFLRPEDIDRLCLVKVLEKERGFERAFFLLESPEDYRRQVDQRISGGEFTEQQLGHAVIEEFVVGVQVNFNFFFSPLSKRVELLGTDTRRQTNFEGITRTPAAYQNEIIEKVGVKYEEAGHIAVTVLESLLEPAFAMAERFVKAAENVSPPGVIGPFALQTIVTPGPPKKEIVVIDVSPRVPGSPGISATPYAQYLYGEPMSVGRRIAREIKEAIQNNKLQSVIT